MSELLKAEHISKHYSGTMALQDVSLTVRSGEVHGLMGENGAGKSTLGKILAGAVQADAGSVLWEGQAVRIGSPQDAQRLGIGIVFQELDLFPNLSVAENIVIGNKQLDRSPFVNWSKLREICEPLLDSTGLRVSPRQKVRELRIGEMQLVSIARALSFKAKLIVMDEATSSLAEDSVQRLFEVLRGLRDRGVSIIYVTHKMNEIRNIADRVTVLRDGKYVDTRDVEDTPLPEIIRMMVGRELSERPPRRRSQTGDAILQVAHLTSDKIRDVSFDLHRGEILGVAGLMGAGRSELGAALFGLDRMRSGTIQLAARAYEPRSPRNAMEAKFGLLPEDRKLEGLMLAMSIRDNTTMASLRQYRRFGFLSSSKQADAARPALHRMRLRARSDQAPVGTLSGGNQQKVLFAKWLLIGPQVLFLDDPTRGIDLPAKQDIYDLMDDLAREGKGILFVSSELPELLANCDRILVMCEGRLGGIVDARSSSQEQIMQLAMGQGVAE